METKYLFDYCERIGQTGLWAEPFNAITNIAFIIAGILSWQTCRNYSIKQYLDIHLLYLLMILIGCGSAIWHISPNHTTLMLDVVPITAFINIYMFSLLRRGFKWNYGKILITFAILHKLNYIANQEFPADYLNGSILYAPTWLILIILCAIAWHKRFSFSHQLIKISYLWSISLFFRTVDHYVCSQITIGTHFIWHLLNALTLYYLLKLLKCLLYKT